MGVPYSTANAESARAEIRKILERFGCESVGFMDRFADKAVLLAFEHRGRSVQLTASAQGWANLWLKENPWTSRRRASRAEWEAQAINQGMRAVNSILRDWVKGQITAIECGILTFDHVFLPYMLTSDGTPLIERLRDHPALLPPATSETP